VGTLSVIMGIVPVLALLLFREVPPLPAMVEAGIHAGEGGSLASL